MKSSKQIFLTIAISLCLFHFRFISAAEPPSLIGLAAPEFNLSGTDGQSHRLSAMLKQGPVIVVWLPKAYTANATRMLEQISPVADELKSKGISVVAIACDKSKYLRAFTRESKIQFPLLADPTRTAAIQWTTVHQNREIPERWAFFINKNGKIQAVETELESAKAGEILKNTVQKLGWPGA